MHEVETRLSIRSEFNEVIKVLEPKLWRLSIAVNAKLVSQRKRLLNYTAADCSIAPS